MAKHFFDDNFTVVSLIITKDTEASDKDLIDEENHDLGRALTFGLFWQPDDQFGNHSDRHSVQLGFEIIYLNSKRTRTTVRGLEEDSESVSLSMMGNLRF